MENREKLEEVEGKITTCQACPLYKTATHAVPGNGNPRAEIILIGEAPGYWEDQRGIPFCGPAGKLLDELLASINLKREDVFVANMLKHRPPNNRDPMPGEMEACKPWLDTQLEIINPKVIITLGRFSMSKFLPYGKISSDHGKGRLVEYNGRRYVFIPMYHPAAALRGAGVDQALRSDFQNIPEEIERMESLVAGKTDETEEIKKEEKEENQQLSLV